MSQELKALSCDNVGKDACPHRSHSSINKAKAICNSRFTAVKEYLTPWDQKQLSSLCNGCPEYVEEE